MKKIYTLIAAVFTAVGVVSAQQLPDNIGAFNSDFWDECYPNSGTNVSGVEPPGWSASNVHQIMPFSNLVTRINDRILTTSGSGAVRMTNYYYWCPLKNNKAKNSCPQCP